MSVSIDLSLFQCSVLYQKVLEKTVCWHTLPRTCANSQRQEIMSFVFHLEKPFKVRVWASFDSLLQYYLNKLHLYVYVWCMIYILENWYRLEADYTSEICFIVISFFFPLENSATLSLYWCLRISLSFQGSEHKSSSRSYSKLNAHLKAHTRIVFYLYHYTRELLL